MDSHSTISTAPDESASLTPACPHPQLRGVREFDGDQVFNLCTSCGRLLSVVTAVAA